MKLPPEIAQSDVYFMRDDGTALVVARQPYAACPKCGPTKALFIVREDQYACVVCDGSDT